MADFDANPVYYTNQNLPTRTEGEEDNFSIGENADEEEVAPEVMRRHLREFLRNYRLNTQYVYREKLLKSFRRSNSRSNELTTNTGVSIEVDIAHLGEYDANLLSQLLSFPNTTLSSFEAAAADALKSLLFALHQTRQEEEPQQQQDVASGVDNEGGGVNISPDVALDIAADAVEVGDVQVLLKGNMEYTDLRKINASHMNRLITCPGIVISAARIRSRAYKVRIRCSRCQDSRILTTGPFSGVNLPMKCMSTTESNECGPGPYELVPDQSSFIDQQTLKLQEAPEMVPTGEMPRVLLLSCERNLVDRCPPGTRVNAIGIVQLFTTGGGPKGNKKTVKQAYLRVVGLTAASAHGSIYATFSPAEEEAFRALSRRSDIYDVLSRSIAPSISGGYTVDIKKALACQLFSGSGKKLSDGMRLRGDINVLLMGDPSTAKSQFLKFIEKIAPVGVYTSGKGSSAAGLTASVIKDQRGEFYLEGGAMVLADGGIVCIDEFDKMRPADRVAIHEAMEQQTISVAKAGITTVLNSRCSVLAAANPVFGRYDELRSATENIDLMSTILSRFDMIFIVRDLREEERDTAICKHVMGIHVDASRRGDGNGHNDIFSNNHREGESEAPDRHQVAESAMRVAKGDGNEELDIPTMKKYVQYCRIKCAPRLTEESAQVLSSSYVKIRDDVRKRAVLNDNKDQAVPITVRQLEALVRISESLAKMRLSAEVSPEDVAEALRLFRVSTMTASAADDASIKSSFIAGAAGEQMARVTAFLQSRVRIGATVNVRRIVEEAAGQGYDPFLCSKALSIMIMRGEMQERNLGKLIRRVK